MSRSQGDELNDTRVVVIHPSASLGSNVVIGKGVVVDAQAVVETGAILDDNVYIGAGSFVGRGCHIGEGSSIRPGVTLYEGTMIGRKVLIETGVVIGSDGFGYAPTPSGHYKVPQVGIVIVKDGVRIGTGSCIDRATLGKTVIDEGVVIGRQVQVGHNVSIGEGTIIGDQCGICGSVRIGRDVRLGCRVGVAGHLIVGDGCIVESFSGVSKSLPAGSHVSGYPAVTAEELENRRRLVEGLPALFQQVREIERRVKVEGPSLPEDPQ